MPASGLRGVERSRESPGAMRRGFTRCSCTPMTPLLRWWERRAWFGRCGAEEAPRGAQTKKVHHQETAIAVQPGKTGRAWGAVDLILAGATITYGELWLLVGLLEHLAALARRDRTTMNGLRRANFRNDGRFGPATTMEFVDSQLEQFKVRRRILPNAAVCLMPVVVRSAVGVVTPAFSDVVLAPGGLSSAAVLPAPPFFIFSDAASEAGSEGLGGWVHGEWWALALSAEDRSLMHITALEFAASASAPFSTGQSCADTTPSHSLTRW